MSDEKRIARSLKRLRRKRGRQVTFHSRSLDLDVVIAKAIVTETEFVSSDSHGHRVQSMALKFLIGTEDLVDEDGDAIEPNRYDTIEVTFNGQTETHQVSPFGNRRNSLFGYSDDGRSQLEVYAKRTNKGE